LNPIETWKDKAKFTKTAQYLADEFKKRA
jgi:ATP-dependent phosphoenolpyruvate carboxykinase